MYQEKVEFCDEYTKPLQQRDHENCCKKKDEIKTKQRIFLKPIQVLLIEV